MVDLYCSWFYRSVWVCLAFYLFPPIASFGQQGKERSRPSPPAFAHETLSYFNGDHPTEVHLALDELRVVAPKGMEVVTESVRGLVPNAMVTATKNGEAHVRFVQGVAGLDELQGWADTLAGQNHAVEAVLYAPAVSERDEELRQLLTNRLSLQVKNGLPIANLLRSYGLAIVETVEYAPNTYIVETQSTDLLSALDTANTLVESGKVEFATPLIRRYQWPRLVPNDALFTLQWHLQHTGQVPGGAGNDANLVPAWDIVTGGGVNIGVIDSGVQVNHPDLTGNARTDLDWDFNSNDDDPTPIGSDDDAAHGTGSAGIAAADGNNSIGVAGAAFDAGIVGLRFLQAPVTDQTEADALSFRTNDAVDNNRVHVSNNSWGPPDLGFGLVPMGPLAKAALDSAAETGRGGLGTIFVWAAGNGRFNEDDVNRDGYASNRHTIAVGASGGDGKFAGYSEAGTAMFLNAPSSYGSTGTTTTDLTGLGGFSNGDYATDFGGTSSSAPLVAGIAALLLDANPTLTWRDVQHVLADSTTLIDPGDSGWFTNGIGRSFNRSYGFGRVNAAAAVNLALEWVNVPSSATPIVQSLSPAVAIPDNQPGGVTDSTTVVANNRFHIEHVEVTLTITHTFRGDLLIELISPAGTVSQLILPNFDDSDDFPNWTFLTLAHWGENPSGQWSLRVTDIFEQEVGVLQSWQLNIFGYLQNKSLIWSDFTHTGVETGEFNRPFNSLAEAAATVESGGTIRIQAGITSETVTVNQAVRLEAVGGTVRIGG